LKVRKEKGLIEDKDEFSMMVGNEKTLADRLGTSPDDIEKKLNAKRKGTYVTVKAIRDLSSVNLYERCCIIVKVVVLISIGEVPKFRICTRARYHDLGYCCIIGPSKYTLE